MPDPVEQLLASFPRVHERAWSGQVPDVLLRRLTELGSQLLHAPDPGLARLGVLLDWWSTSVVGRSLTGGVHELDKLGDHAVRAAIEPFAREGALRAAHRPYSFAHAVRALHEVIDRHPPKFSKSPGSELYNEARDEAWRVYNAATRDHADRPPAGLRLYGDGSDTWPEEWAAEQRGSHALQYGLKVHNSLAKHLRHLGELVGRVRELWTTEQAAERRPVDVAIAEPDPTRRALAECLLYDLERLGRDLPPPAGLEPEGARAALERAFGGRGVEETVQELAVLRELLPRQRREWPSWAVEAEERLVVRRDRVQGLQVEARLLDNPDPAAMLDFALDAIQRLELAEVDQWLSEAEASIAKAREDEEAREIASRAAQATTDLARALEILRDIPTAPAPAVDVPSQDAGGDRRAFVARVEEARARLAGQLQEELLRLGHVHLPDVDANRGRARRVEEARRCLERDQLSEAARHLRALVEHVEAARAQAEASLTPQLLELSAAIERLGPELSEVKVQLSELVGRISYRASEGLSHVELLRHARRHVEALRRGEVGELPRLAVERVEPSMRRRRFAVPFAWLGTGLPVAGAWEGEQALDDDQEPTAHRLIVLPSGEVPPARFADLIEVASLERPNPYQVLEYAGTADISDAVYLYDGQGVQGPYRIEDDGTPSPLDERGFVVRLDLDEVALACGIAEGPRLGGDRRRFLVDPPSVDDMLQLGGQPVDSLGERELERWLGALTRELHGVDLSGLGVVVERLTRGAAALPAEIVGPRVERLKSAFATAQAFASARREAVEAWIVSPDGEAERRLAARAWVQANTDRLAPELDVLERRRRALEDEIRNHEARLEEERARLLRDEESLLERKRQLEDDVAELRALKEDARARALVELLGRPGAPAVAAARPVADDAGIVARPFPRREDVDLRTLVREVHDGLHAWDEHEVANVLACLLSGGWTLLAGPPGVGKSTFVRAVLTRLGHGPGTDRYLELVVRRDWQDDAALFGFFHPEQGRWVPSSEGLVEHLLTAAHDHAHGVGGLYACLLEELNLASPEYYLARPISALEAASPQVRLYGPELSPTNAVRYPRAFPLTPNVRFVGTVNVDDTVERLSPRFLSRAAVIWMEPDAAAFDRPAIQPEAPDGAVDWGARLREVAPAEVPAPVRQVVDFLYEERVPGMPSPRAMRAIERYMGVAGRCMSPELAADYAVAQRVLPSLRGIGERYRRVFDNLGNLLRRLKLQRSGERVAVLRERGEESGDYYDAFHC